MKRNPSDPHVTYWVVLSAIVVGGVAIWAWKAMTPKQQATALPGLGAPPFSLVSALAMHHPAAKQALGALPVPTRESCLECVDKHLGAAMVLMTETRDGYPHRLRAIGHLHEAEDESQVWPELHDAIRSARKLFQQTGRAPDFDFLEALSMKARGMQRAA